MAEPKKHDLSGKRATPAPGVMSVDTETLIKKLREAQQETTIEYATIAFWLGRAEHPRAAWRGILGSARRYLLREERILFETVTDRGIRRLKSSEIVEGHVAGDIRKLARATRRSLRKLACAEYDDLSPSEKASHNAKASHLGALEMMFRPTTIKRIEQKVSQSGDKLPVAKTLELFAPREEK